jgi:hypothetical protein
MESGSLKEEQTLSHAPIAPNSQMLESGLIWRIMSGHPFHDCVWIYGKPFLDTQAM